MKPNRCARGIALNALLCTLACLAACSKSEPPAPVKPSLPTVPAVVTPAREPVVVPPAAPEPSVEQHIPGTPEARQFVASYVTKQHPTRVTHPVPGADSAYDVAYRNAARADKLLHRHAYVQGFDDAAATNAVALDRAYR